MKSENFWVINTWDNINIVSIFLDFSGWVRWDFVLKLVVTTSFELHFHELMFGVTEDSVFNVIISVGVEELSV